jgi:hypothetical protein
MRAPSDHEDAVGSDSRPDGVRNEHVGGIQNRSGMVERLLSDV